MRTKTWIVGALLSLSALVPFAGERLASADGTNPSPPPASCGTSDNPCPLQKWMRANMGAALAAADTDALAKALDHVAGLSPDPSWATWSQFAKQGSTAAAAKDMNGVKASCKSCHDAYKDKYKAQYRAKPFS